MLRRVSSHLLLLVLIVCFGGPLQAASQAILEGRVVAAGGDQPLAGAQIVLSVSGVGPLYRSDSDAQGSFRLPAVEPGEYRLRVEVSGYFPVEQDIVLRPR